MGALDLPDEGPEETGADVGDDDLGFVPDPAERTWRHPSEIAAANAHAARYARDEAASAAAGNQPTPTRATDGWTQERLGQSSYRLVGTLVAGALLAGFVVLQFQGPRPAERARSETPQLDSDVLTQSGTQQIVPVSTTAASPAEAQPAEGGRIGVTTSLLPTVRSGENEADQRWGNVQVGTASADSAGSSDSTGSSAVTVPGVYAVRVSVQEAPDKVSTVFGTWGPTIGIRSPKVETALFGEWMAGERSQTTSASALAEDHLLCSGVDVGDYILTSASALAGHQTVQVEVGSETVTFIVAGLDPSSDIAVLVTEDALEERTDESVLGADVAPEETSAEEASAEEASAEDALAVETDTQDVAVRIHPEPALIAAGDQIHVVSGIPHKAHTGTVLAIADRSQTATGQELFGLLSTTAVLPGNAAGGAIMDRDGQVIGIVVNDHRYLASGIRIDRAMEVAEALLSAGTESTELENGNEAALQEGESVLQDPLVEDPVLEETVLED